MVVIAGPNLVAIDIAARREGWRTRFAGQGNYGLPAIGNGRVFALRAGTLEVFSEASGERLWTLRPPSDALSSSLVLTASHVFAASSLTAPSTVRARHGSASSFKQGQLGLAPPRISLGHCSHTRATAHSFDLAIQFCVSRAGFLAT